MPLRRRASTSSGVLAGAISASQKTASKPGTPAASSTVGSSGRMVRRWRVVTAMPCVRPARIRGAASFAAENMAWITPPMRSCAAGAPPR